MLKAVSSFHFVIIKSTLEDQNGTHILLTRCLHFCVFTSKDLYIFRDIVPKRIECSCLNPSTVEAPFNTIFNQTSSTKIQVLFKFVLQ